MTHRAKWPPQDLVREVRTLQHKLDESIRSHRGSAWYLWTPTWTASVTNPSLGDGTLEGRYMRVGYTVYIRMFLKMGTTTTMGSGPWSFTLPFPVVSFTDSPGTVFDSGVMSAVAQDLSTFLRYPGVSYLTDDYHIWRTMFGQGTNGADATDPFTWASGDILMVSGFYETDQ